MNFLFWNVDVINKPFGKDINMYICNLLDSYNVDIAILAEYDTADKDNLLNVLFSKSMCYYHVPQRGCKLINIITKLNPDNFEPLTDSSRYTLYRIPHNEYGYLIIALVHLPSKLNYSDRTQEEIARRLKSDIEHDEVACQTQNTLIIGDLNMNPFEEGLVHAASLHSFSSREFIKQRKGSREILDVHYSMFYNPMWSCFGDTKIPYGSYFYGDSDIISYGWNIFDQVLVRPSLMECLDPSKIEIVSRIKSQSLLDQNMRPNRSISDHLPLFFCL